MASEDNVLYALLAFLIGGIIMFAIYKNKSACNEKFRQINANTNRLNKTKEKFNRDLAAKQAIDAMKKDVIEKRKLQQNDANRIASDKFKDILVRNRERALSAQQRLSIGSCPCADNSSDCPLGCDCVLCSGEPPPAINSPPVYINLANPSSSAIRDTTRANADSLRGDVNITSPPLTTNGMFVPYQASQSLFKGGRSIVFGVKDKYKSR